ncbi:molybdenum cofactor biosynthesis protein MoaE [Devosia sp. PTR5]|uniref:Molybdopterin synthase catalytic subunit n=1 Tax=Devosia oryzisoli TaxID=2774138 RepID=A0A927IRR0_9HYPH|nr:molybdenum cofactor biosynthesis protein MoaE [Devosia oryzisoli]MBD8063963.1 molybdenum cofactor biosynthesis protein MoaE [Devosia oryzisoli]
MIRVTADPFDPGLNANRFQAESEGAGAMVTFTGIVRSTPDRPITALVLECYPALAEHELAEMRDRAIVRFGLIDAAITHRHGRLLPGDTIMQVITLAPHRRAAFEGAAFLMDYLKTDAPFWKQEETENGLEWVAAKSEDDAARGRWS